MTDVVIIVARIALAVYAGVCLVIVLRQGSYVYYPDRTLKDEPDDVGLAFEDVTLKSEGRVPIHAWYVPAASEDAPVVLFCHGNAGNLSGRLDWLLTFYNLGFSTLAFDYRGYGRSRGRPTEAGTYADVEAAWAWLTEEQGIPPSRIVVFGRSLGGGIATHMALKETPAMLLLECSFTSARDMAAGMFPLLPGRWLCRFGYDNLERIAHIRCPVMIAHSPDDRTVPFAMGKALYRAAPEPKSFVAMTGGHDNGSMNLDRGYRAAFMEFWNEHRPQESGETPDAPVTD